MSSLEPSIYTDLSQAMKAKDEPRVATLRLLKSALEKVKKTGQIELTDNDVVKIIRSEVKKRKEASESYRSAQRIELALREEAELEILKSYLPAEMSEAELATIIQSVIAEHNPTMKDFGQVMKLVIARSGGRADGSTVSGLVKKYLAN